jgi:2-C-methyl-D-erythritol 2,4-cyclodiphosphate synthase
MTVRVGFGYDSHRLVEGRPLMLGGIHVPHPVGSMGHSDADVLLHALCDALLGALALGDIGAHFPDTDPAYKDADSRKLLENVLLRVPVDAVSVKATTNERMGFTGREEGVCAYAVALLQVA